MSRSGRGAPLASLAGATLVLAGVVPVHPLEARPPELATIKVVAVDAGAGRVSYAATGVRSVGPRGTPTPPTETSVGAGRAFVTGRLSVFASDEDLARLRAWAEAEFGRGASVDERRPKGFSLSIANPGGDDWRRPFASGSVSVFGLTIARVRRPQDGKLLVSGVAVFEVDGLRAQAVLAVYWDRVYSGLEAAKSADGIVTESAVEAVAEAASAKGWVHVEPGAQGAAVPGGEALLAILKALFRRDLLSEATAPPAPVTAAPVAGAGRVYRICERSRLGSLSARVDLSTQSPPVEVVVELRGEVTLP